MVGLRSLPPAAAPIGWSGIWQAIRGWQHAQDDFARALAEYLQARHVYLADSGRSVLFLLLESLRDRPEWRERSEVVLPAYTCPALTKVIVDAGLRPRWVDLHPHSLQIMPSELARVVHDATLAILVVHPFGIPHPLSEVAEVANQAGALLIEDAAQSLGARDEAGAVGTVADFGMFSFGPGKPLSTGGGGLLTTSQTRFADILDERWRTVAVPGPLTSLLALMRLGLMEALFHPTVWGIAAAAGLQRVGENEASWGYRVRRLTSVQAAAGLRQLAQFEAANAHRRLIAERLTATIGNSERLRPALPVRPAGIQAETQRRDGFAGTWRPIYVRYPVLAKDVAIRDALYLELVKAGIGAGKMYRKTMPDFFPNLSGGPFPGAQQIVDTILTLPTHRYVTAQDLSTMQQVLRRWL